MKIIWLHIFRTYIKIGLFFYYKRIEVKFKEPVPTHGPVLFVANHNNALMDALLIATQSGRFSYFLTRASVFKKPIVNKFLRSLHMLPVYRIRDGWSTIANNTSVFENCSRCLAAGEAVSVFPEGNHHMNRTVRPLSKGFTRIVFETLDKCPDCDLKIIPIGLNYEQADAFPDRVLLNFGPSIAAKNYFKSNLNTETNRLKNDVWESLTQLTSHIPPTDYDITLEKLQARHANFLKPEVVNTCLATNFKTCVFQKPKQHQKAQLAIKNSCKFLIILLLIGPYAIWKLLAKPKIREVEFVATFRFGVSITLVPLWLAIMTLLLLTIFGVEIGLTYLCVTLIISLLAVKL